MCGTDSNVIIWVIYRPPDTDIRLFNESLCYILSALQIENKLCYLLGDYNLNLLNTDSHTLTREFVDIMYSYSLLPNIIKPIRERSATLIDNIFSNDLLSKNASISGLLDTDITDHFPVFHVVFSSKVNINRHRSTFWSINSVNIDKFLNEISHHDWTPVMQSSDAQESFSIFHASFLQIYNRCFPFRSKSAYKCNKHWLSEPLKKYIKENNRLYKYYKRKPNLNSEMRYKTYKNILTTTLRAAEKAYYSKLVEENKSNLGASWRILKEVINKKKKSSVCFKFKLNDRDITDKRAISDGFNNFFVNVGPNLASKIPQSSTSCTKYIKGGHLTETLFLCPTYEEEITNIIKNLKSGSDAGWDEISTNTRHANTYFQFVIIIWYIS